MNAMEKSKNELAKAYERGKATLARARTETKAITGRAVNSALTVGSAYGVGALRNKFGEGAEKKLLIPGTEIEGDLALGVIATLAGVAGLAEDKSDLLAAVGSGSLAAYVAIASFQRGYDMRAD